MSNATSCELANGTPTGGYFAHRRRGEKPCGLCTKRFSRDSADRRAANGRKKYVAECRFCGETFNGSAKHIRYCSQECWQAVRRRESVALTFFGSSLPRCDLPKLHPAMKPAVRARRPFTFVEGPCLWCGERFTIVHQLEARYCSESCSRHAGRARCGRFAVPSSVRQSIYERDGWVCQLCDDPVDPDLGPSDPWAATLDHIVCQSWTLVPDDRPSNLRLAHRWCNSVRGDESHYGPEVLARGERAA